MENTEIPLRIKQIVERTQLIEKHLSEISELRKVPVKKSKDFIGSYDLVRHEKHWKNFCVSSRRQLYGLNQKIIVMRRVQQSALTVDAGLLRLIAQASLKASQLLKGLLQFAPRLHYQENDPANIITHILVASKQLLLLLQGLGFTGADTDQDGRDESFGTSIAEVESSVVEELRERGTAARHLARLAKQRLDPMKRKSGPTPKSVTLPRGRRMVLLEDSLSHLIGKHKHTSRSSKDTARSSSTGVLSMPSKIRHSLPKTSHRRRHRSLSERRGSDRRHRKKERQPQDDEAQRQLLWQQLLPLLLNQEVLELNVADGDFQRYLRQLDNILERVDTLQSSVEYNYSLFKECKELEEEAEQVDDSLTGAIHKAKKLMRKAGFLPPDSADDNFRASIVDESDSDVDDSIKEIRNQQNTRASRPYSDIRLRNESF